MCRYATTIAHDRHSERYLLLFSLNGIIFCPESSVSATFSQCSASVGIPSMTRSVVDSPSSKSVELSLQHAQLASGSELVDTGATRQTWSCAGSTRRLSFRISTAGQIPQNVRSVFPERHAEGTHFAGLFAAVLLVPSSPLGQFRWDSHLGELDFPTNVRQCT